MIRLWPQSLFGQLMFTLVLTLTLAQLVSAVILFYERGQSLHEVLGLQSVERISSMTRLFDDLSPQARQQALKVFSTPNLRISFNREPIADVKEDHDQLHKALETLILRTMNQQRPIRIHVYTKESDVEDSLINLSEEITSTDQPRSNKKNNTGWSRWYGGSNQNGTHWMKWDSQQANKDTSWSRWRANETTRAPVILKHPFLIQLQLKDGSWVSFVQPFPEELFSLPYRFFASLLILLVTVSLLSFIVVRWITKPISTLAVAADELGRDIQRSPLEENGPREVAQAAHAFNIMQSRINQYIQDRSQLLAAISHDLRTPITRLRLRTELLNNEALKKKFLGDLEDMQTMVNETLDYMRGHDRKEAIQKIDINALVDSLVEDMRDAGHQMNIEGKSQKVYRGRPLALKRCLTNLLENAIRYGENATIWIEESEKNLILRIVDTGPGIPQDQLDKIFEPFFRLDSSRNRSSGGVGLGLGIARDIARANGGDLYLRNSDEGGLEAVLELPNSLT